MLELRFDKLFKLISMLSKRVYHIVYRLQGVTYHIISFPEQVLKAVEKHVNM